MFLFRQICFRLLDQRSFSESTIAKRRKDEKASRRLIRNESINTMATATQLLKKQRNSLARTRNRSLSTIVEIHFDARAA